MGTTPPPRSLAAEVSRLRISHAGRRFARISARRRPLSTKSQQMMAIVMREGTHRFEWTHKRIDGTEFLASVCVSRMEVDGKCLLLGTARHHRAEVGGQALEASERRFSDVLHASNDAMLLLDGNRFIDCNEAAAKMLGFATIDECIFTHPARLSPPTQPDGRPSHEKAAEMIEIVRREGYHRFEWVHTRADGADLPVEVSLTAIVAKGKNLLLCLWRDISAQWRAEEGMRTSETKYRTLFDASSDAILLRTPERRIIGGNRAAVALFGCKDESELIARRGRRFMQSISLMDACRQTRPPKWRKPLSARVRISSSGRTREETEASSSPRFASQEWSWKAS